VEVVIAPPAVYLKDLQKLATKSSLKIGAQNVHYDVKGAYTGEHSCAQLSEFGVSHIIIGHSERRALGETDEFIAKKLAAIIKAKLFPVLCIGEKERDPQANFFTLIERQIKTALAGLPKGRAKDVVIAYEPIWAIGTGIVATVSDVQEMNLYIKKVLTNIFDRATAAKVRVIYGGSVSVDNSAELFKGAQVDGFLVGGASLRAMDFIKIITSVS
jgi:triosephosphate isomerase